MMRFSQRESVLAIGWSNCSPSGVVKNHFVVVPFRLQGRDAAVYRFALHHHARKAAERIVVHPAVLIRGIVAQVVQMDFHQAFLWARPNMLSRTKPSSNSGKTVMMSILIIRLFLQKYKFLFVGRCFSFKK